MRYAWEKDELAAEDLADTCPYIPHGCVFLMRRHKDKNVMPGPYDQVCNVVKTGESSCSVKGLLSLEDFTKQERRDVVEFGRSQGFTTGTYERFDEDGIQYATVMMWK